MSKARKRTRRAAAVGKRVRAIEQEMGRDAARQVADTDYIGRVAADVLKDAARGVPAALEVLREADADLDVLTLTRGGEARLVRRVLEGRGWSREAVDRILAPKSPMERGDIFTPTYDPPAAAAGAENQARRNALTPPGDRLEPIRTSELQAALGSLEREQERVDRLVAELETKIADVLRPRPPQGEGSAAPVTTKPGFVEQSSAVGRCVVAVARRLQQIGDVVLDITERAQV